MIRMGRDSLQVCVLFSVKGDCLPVQIYYLKFCLTSGEGKGGKRRGERREEARENVFAYTFKYLFTRGLSWKDILKTGNNWWVG